ncbi:MAG: molybdopterin adenylyltransferase [Halanaerobiales bacterium]|nr:molybdopterin adenylyltransferase [Halanaerobiales bacterium]
MIRVAILTVSDRGSAGKREDLSGKVIEEMIKEFDGEKVYYNIVPDEFGRIKEELFNISERGLADLILTTGGTGFARRDVTPEATMTVVEKEVPGITEMMRWETAKITPNAYLSRARAGIRKSTLIINLPGKPKAVKECLKAIIPVILHGIEILRGDVTEH